MKTIALGKSDIQITPVVMGTWQAGKKMWAGIQDSESIEALRAAYESGITTIDTAAVYGDGHSERIVAKALGDRRDELVYCTKVFAHNLAYDKVLRSCEQSLKDLDTDYIDLFQIHWPAGSFGSKKVPVEETMSAMEQLKKQGKIKAVGVSNFSRAQIEEACRYGQIDSVQPPYSLFWRHFEKDAAAFCRENDITVLAYSSMAQGLLTGKFGPDHTFAKGDHRSKSRLFQPEMYERVQQALERLRPLAQKQDITLGQLALSWVLSHPNTCAIAGARSADQVRENAAAAEVVLSKEVLEEMDAIGRLVTDRLDDNPVIWKF